MSAVSIGVAKDGQLRVGVRALSWACVAKDLMRLLNFTDLHRVSWAGAPGHLWALPRRALHGASGAWCLPQRPHGSTWLKTSMNIDGFPMFSPPFPFIFLYFPIMIQPLEELLDEFDEFGDPPVHTHPVLKLRPKYPCLRCQRAFRGAAWVWEPHWDDLDVDMARTWLKVLKAIIGSSLQLPVSSDSQILCSRRMALCVPSPASKAVVASGCAPNPKSSAPCLRAITELAPKTRNLQTSASVHSVVWHQGSGTAWHQVCEPNFDLQQMCFWTVWAVCNWILRRSMPPDGLLYQTRILSSYLARQSCIFCSNHSGTLLSSVSAFPWRKSVFSLALSSLHWAPELQTPDTSAKRGLRKTPARATSRHIRPICEVAT